MTAASRMISGRNAMRREVSRPVPGDLAIVAGFLQFERERTRPSDQSLDSKTRDVIGVWLLASGSWLLVKWKPRYRQQPTSQKPAANECQQLLLLIRHRRLPVRLLADVGLRVWHGREDGAADVEDVDLPFLLIEDLAVGS